jgi:opacity protein-like surface antigen
MCLKPSSRIDTDIPLLILATLLLLAQPSSNAVAEDLLGLYVGGAIGQSRVEASPSQPVEVQGGVPIYGVGTFDQDHTAFKLALGIRPISLLGAEIAYVDFGRPRGTFGGYPTSAEMKATAAFGVVYLPVTAVDILLKAGIARTQTTITGIGFGANCGQGPSRVCSALIYMVPYQQESTNSAFAWGAGVQHKFGSWAVRAEYERFNAAGGNPSLLSAGLTWTFL